MTEIAQRYGLGAPDQISFAVADVDEAVPRYASIFGAFNIIQMTLPEVTCYGRVTSVTLKLAFAQCGPLEIELVEVISGDHPATEHLAEQGESLHHVRFSVASVAATRAAMEAAGFVASFSGESQGIGYVYLESPATLGETRIELIGPAS